MYGTRLFCSRTDTRDWEFFFFPLSTSCSAARALGDVERPAGMPRLSNIDDDRITDELAELFEHLGGSGRPIRKDSFPPRSQPDSLSLGLPS